MKKLVTLFAALFSYAAVWAENLEEFKRLSKLENDPGYRDMVAFRTALYRLVKKYPLAAHFVWK